MDLKLTPIDDGVYLYHDISFTLGKIDTVDGIEEITNRITCNLAVYLGENFTDPTFGIDFFNNISGRDVTDTVLIDELKAAILDTRGVTGLKSFDITEQDRVATLVAQVETTVGEINLVTPIQT